MSLLIQYTILYASVLILVALGGCFSEHSGVINLGLEGIMVMGALGGALTMKYMIGYPPAVIVILTILAAAVTGLVFSALLAVACINFKADQTIVGTALNMLGNGHRKGDKHRRKPRQRFGHRAVHRAEEVLPRQYRRL